MYQSLVIEEALQDMASQIVRLSLTEIKLQETRKIDRKLQYLQNDRKNALKSKSKNLKSLPKVTHTFRLRKLQLGSRRVRSSLLQARGGVENLFIFEEIGKIYKFSLKKTSSFFFIKTM